MRDIRVYIAETLTPNQTLALPDNAHRHCHKVLRLRRDDQLWLFNGDGFDYLAKINDTNRQQTTVFIEQQKPLQNESPLQMTLYLALLKGEAMDRSIQKAVELGASKIVPVNSERSERQVHAERIEKKYEHWQGVIISAAMQCGRAKLTDLGEVLSFAEVIESEKAAIRWIFSPHDEKESSPTTQTTEIALLVGPEGGFSPAEVSLAQQAGWRCQSLGKRILRADTAAIAAMVRAQSQFGDLEC